MEARNIPAFHYPLIPVFFAALQQKGLAFLKTGLILRAMLQCSMSGETVTDLSHPRFIVIVS